MHLHIYDDYVFKMLPPLKIKILKYITCIYIYCKNSML